MIAFDKLVDKRECTKFVAAQALAHVLLLATKKVLSVYQDKPYGPILLSNLIEI